MHCHISLTVINVPTKKPSLAVYRYLTWCKSYTPASTQHNDFTTRRGGTIGNH